MSAGIKIDAKVSSDKLKLRVRGGGRKGMSKYSDLFEPTSKLKLGEGFTAHVADVQKHRNAIGAAVKKNVPAPKGTEFRFSINEENKLAIHCVKAGDGKPGPKAKAKKVTKKK